MIWDQGSPNQAKWATSSPWFQWNRPISVLISSLKLSTYAAGPESRGNSRTAFCQYIDVKLLPKFHCSLDSYFRGSAYPRKLVPHELKWFQRPSQILRSMTDLMLSNQHPFQSEDLYVLLPCHIMDVGQVYTSSTFRLLWNHFNSWGTNFRG
jgi:hypothetical protein